ncbi:MAG: sensor domain-containing diguanylate cyclase [Gammaproteobacteria bacterium]|nr:sensor domain-containing diguanylate cyclase [Gammaproteobacteria bacterium]MBU1602680.1 sensor domain-containing diguanylate cyclase [Gammaproteobacteria bacterium]MBU2433485.1 sensor domain-containing diguanylate cyclase [Gammaproteobacteria bacterium]MBU2451401.1 sensor domain-containing diguanylate cyclase [Gammaproteobacteria bacterium]
MTDEDLYRERLHLALEAGGLDLWENNLTTGEVTHRVTRIFSDLGYDKQESLAYIDDLFALVHPDDQPLVKQAIAAHLAGETRQYRCEFRLRTHNGDWVWHANYGKIMDVGGRLGTRFIGVTFNIDDRKRREEELAAANQQLARQNAELDRMNAALQVLATTDALTGLANRRLLIETGEKECRRGPRFAQPLSLLILDIDHFKNVNDQWGHPVGDRVLIAIADLCRSRFRQGTDVVARIGGEEFAILMPATPYEEGKRVAEWLREAIANLRIDVAEDITATCTASIGVASLPAKDAQATDAAWNFDQLFIAADRALYQAKAAGRNSVCGAEG